MDYQIAENSANIIKTQVVIVGAGPTGLSMAALLLRSNIDFTILEKNATTTTLSKAIVVQARTLEIFQELAIDEKAINEGRITTGLNLFYKGEKRTAIDINGLGEGLSAFPFALSLEQSKTEKLLVDYLFEHGKNINWNSEVTRLEQSAKGITAYYKDGIGHVQRVDADFLVGCDGASSPVRHQLGLEFEGKTEPKLFYVADVILKSPVISKDELYMYMTRKGFVLFFPMEGANHYRIIGVVPGAENINKEFEFADVEPIIKEQIITPVVFDKLNWFSTYKVHSRKADAFMKGRCFIAGDAAHIHTPAGGQGMNTGIQDAYNLAWKITATLKGDVNSEVLETYNSERTENAKHLLKTTDRMFDIMSGATAFWNFVRLNFLAPLLRWITKFRFLEKQFFPLISQTGIAYPHSSLTIKSSIGKVKAGDRMHYFVFSHGKQIFYYLREPVFKLLFFGDNKVAAVERVISKPKMINYHFQEIPAGLFGKEKDFYILLRPDNHICYIGKEIGRCRELMNRIAVT